MRLSVLLLSLSALTFAQPRTLPRHLIGQKAPLTAPSYQTPRAIAERHVREMALKAGYAEADLAGLYIAREYSTDHNGVTHILYRQQFQGIDVYGAAWGVNIASDGSILNAGGRIYSAPAPGVFTPQLATSMRAVRTAALSVNPKLGARYTPFTAPGAKSPRAVAFHRGPFAEDIEGEMVWFPVGGNLRPAWRFLIADADQSLYEVVADSDTSTVFARRSMTFFQQPQPPRGLVYERESPQPNPNPGTPLTAPPPYVSRSLQSFAGDPVASPKGWVAGTETSGNNTVTGENLSGTNFITNPKTAVAANKDFSFPLQVGPTAPSPMTYGDAVTTNLFYWVNRAHDSFYKDGFDEKSGNFQVDNYGKGGVGGDPVLAYTHFGASANSNPLTNNSSFSVRAYTDGSTAALRMYIATFAGNFFTDGALDSGVIMHEYTHGVSGRLANLVYYTFQGGAMGEAWSDFFGAEYTTPAGAPADGSYPIGEYFTQAFGAGIRTRPYSTNTDIDPLTYAQLGRVTYFPEVHADGEIWVEALWELRGGLIKQFGEAEGRRRARVLILDGMKLMPPMGDMVDARDAILLADRVDFKGASQDTLWTAFAKRGLGILAQSPGGNSAHILASFDKPSNRASLRFYENPLTIGEPAVIVLQDANNTSDTAQVDILTGGGDRELVTLSRVGAVFTGSISTSGSSTSVTRNNGSLQLVPGDVLTAYFFDADSGSGAVQVTATTNTQPEYTISIPAGYTYKFANESPVFSPGGVYNSTDVNFSLPFPFPFYGKTYMSVQVHTGGAISFGLPPDGFPCADRASFTEFAAIAPLFGEIQFGGNAQPSENIYVSRQTPDSFTIRWAGESISLPTPVNFAATLYSDGRILYQYGTGNQNLGNTASVYGCTSAGPVVGISPGHETYALTLGVRNLDSAGPFLFTPATNAKTAPQTVLEAPLEGAHVTDSLTVSGLAWDTGEAITRVDISIDGVVRGRASINLNRPDACAQSNVAGCPFIGFSSSLVFATLGLAPGTHTLQLSATNARGAVSTFPAVSRTFIIDSVSGAAPQAAFDKALAGTTISGTVSLTGYVYDPVYRISSVDLMVDGLTYGSALYGLSRNDICGTLKNVPNCPAVGFSVSLNTVNGVILLPNGDHTLQLRVRDQSGHTTVLPDGGVTVTVNNDPRPVPVLVLESPTPNQSVSGTFTISGYAYVPGGKVGSVSVTIDGLTYTTAPATDARPDICGTLAGATCPNIGFHATLDSRLLSNGVHALRVSVTSDKGVRVGVPSVFSGQNLYVQN